MSKDRSEPKALYGEQVVGRSVQRVVESRIWLVLEGAYYQDSYLLSVWKRKKDAEAFVRGDGFRFSSEQGFYCNEKTRHYRKIRGEDVFYFQRHG